MFERINYLKTQKFSEFKLHESKKPAIFFPGNLSYLCILGLTGKYLSPSMEITSRMPFFEASFELTFVILHRKTTQVGCHLLCAWLKYSITANNLLFTTQSEDFNRCESQVVENLLGNEV